MRMRRIRLRPQSKNKTKTKTKSKERRSCCLHSSLARTARWGGLLWRSRLRRRRMCAESVELRRDTVVLKGSDRI